jgi:heme exporter protein A
MGHSPALYEDLTAAENLEFAFRMKRLRLDTSTIPSALRDVGLEAHARERVRRFSAGMRRRLALARVLAPLPDLLLMDEPYASLDSEGVELVNEGIRRVVAQDGAVVMATHDFTAGGEVTDRVVTLRNGRLVGTRTAGPDDAAPRPSGRASLDVSG